MPPDERLWRVVQRHLGYTNEEAEEFRRDPRNVAVVEKGGEVSQTLIVLEVVESHGCNSRHHKGDKFYFDGAGNLFTDLSPKKICLYALHSASLLVFTANEMIYAGVDPNTIKFRRANCFDVGLECGGWGRIVLELRTEERSASQPIR